MPIDQENRLPETGGRFSVVNPPFIGYNRENPGIAGGHADPCSSGRFMVDVKTAEVAYMPKILRIRYIPPETVDISGDRLLYRDQDILVTAWEPIRPRTDFHHGMSCVFLAEGLKISRFMDAAGLTLYWYVDLVDIHHDPVADTYRLYDLLADVRIRPDGKLEIVDLDELADALEQKLITAEQGILALRILHHLLGEIEKGTQPRRADFWMKKACETA